MTNETVIQTNTPPRSDFSLRRQGFSVWLMLLSAALGGGFFAYQIFGSGDEKQISFLSDLLQAAFSILAVLGAWRVARHPLIDSQSRTAWRVTAAAFALYAFGHTTWFYLSSIAGEEPFPSIADIGFWGFYPLMLWALLAFPTAKIERSDWLKFVMDIGIVVLGSVIVVWYFIIQPTIAGGEGDAATKLLNLSYIVGDLVLLLGIATVLLRRPLRANRSALLILVVGLLNTLVSDIGFAYFTLQKTYHSGHWIDNFFISGLLIFLFSAYFQHAKLTADRAADAERDEAAARVHSFGWLPYAGVVGSCLILLLETQPYWTETLGAVVFASIAMMILVVVRQIVAVKQNTRLLAEQAERESEKHFRLLVQHSSDLIAILDLNGCFTFQSPSFKTILGYENDELIGKNCLVLANRADVPQIKADFQLLLDDPRAVLTREYNYLHKDGSWRILESITKTINDEENLISGLLFNLRDVTERRETENKLRAFTVKLERSNRELQDFAYVASHDLQEPLRKVQAFGDRLHKKYADRLGDEGGDYVQRMRDAADRMQTLINDLLTFSRVSTKVQPFVPTDLRAVAAGVLSDLEIKIDETQATIEIAELPAIEADPLQMRQLLQNLIGNALKFSRPDAPPHIKIFALEDESEIHSTPSSAGKIVKFVVEDNGIGFDEKYLDRIFTVFQRLHGRSEYAGSGVGLAVCRRIAERHGGGITARSTPGQGSSFIFSLPVNQTKEQHFND